MLVTAGRLEEVINQIRKIDFSVFYREVLFSDPDKGINHENIMKEVLPDIILMPNAGTKAMMWQETAGVKRDTSARFMFPVFTAVDLEDMMIETMGRYRWEICRKIQGVHWNDIREKSLTAEYCDYMQFYRKNFELSADAKEKLKNALFRAKNNYREVFVKDYQNWIKYESRGSYRLNKVSRQILMTYCPFSKELRNELKANPMYQELLKYILSIFKKQFKKCIFCVNLQIIEMHVARQACMQKKKKILYTKQEDILSWQRTWMVQTRVKTVTVRTVMRTAMDRIRVVRTNLLISPQISPQTDPQTKLLIAITKRSSTENRLLHNM